MANLTITIPDAQAVRMVNAIANAFGYNAATDGTKTEFARQQIIKWLKRNVADYEGSVAAASAMQAKSDEVNAISIT